MSLRWAGQENRTLDFTVGEGLSTPISSLRLPKSTSFHSHPRAAALQKRRSRHLQSPYRAPGGASDTPHSVAVGGIGPLPDFARMPVAHYGVAAATGSATGAGVYFLLV